MKAVVVVEGAKAELKDIPKLVPKDDEVLAKVKAVSHNPTDWKHVRFISKPGAISGCDFAGVVEEVGKDVTTLKVGDRIAGFIHGGTETGTFAEYVTIRPSMTFKIPSQMTFEEASTFPVACGTAAIALYHILNFPTPEETPITPKPKILIWGGSSSVGQYAIQLAKLSGISVITTASPHSHSLLRSLGADKVIDYRDPNVVQQIKEWSGGELIYGLDCISEDNTVPPATQAMTGGKLVLLLSSSVKAPGINPAVTLHPFLGYSVLGKEFTILGKTFPADLKMHEFGKKWNEVCTRLTAQGKIKPPKITVIGGLDAFEIGYQRLQNKQVKAEKLVMVVE